MNFIVVKLLIIKMGRDNYSQGEAHEPAGTLKRISTSPSISPSIFQASATNVPSSVDCHQGREISNAPLWPAVGKLRRLGEMDMGTVLVPPPTVQPDPWAIYYTPLTLIPGPPLWDYTGLAWCAIVAVLDMTNYIHLKRKRGGGGRWTEKSSHFWIFNSKC